MCPAAASWRAVSSPSPLVAPVMSVVVMVSSLLPARGAPSRLPFLGLAVPGCAPAGYAYWRDDSSCRYRAGRGAAGLAGPAGPGRGRVAGSRRPPGTRPAPGGTGPAGRPVRRLRHPPGAGPVQRAVGPGAGVAGPGAAAVRRGTGSPVPARGQPAPGPGLVPSHLTPGLQRLLDHFTGTPVSVYDAAWTLLAWNPLWAPWSVTPPGRGAGTGTCCGGTSRAPVPGSGTLWRTRCGSRCPPWPTCGPARPGTPRMRACGA